jgi:hypothetical protein
MGEMITNEMRIKVFQHMKRVEVGVRGECFTVDLTVRS